MHCCAECAVPCVCSQVLRTRHLNTVGVPVGDGASDRSMNNRDLRTRHLNTDTVLCRIQAWGQPGLGLIMGVGGCIKYDEVVNRIVVIYYINTVEIRCIAIKQRRTQSVEHHLYLRYLYLEE